MLKKIICFITSFFYKKIICFITDLFCKKKRSVKEIDEPQKKYSVDEIVELLDKVYKSNDDIYTNIALFISEVKDLYEANSETRDKEKEDCYNTLKVIQEQIDKV